MEFGVQVVGDYDHVREVAVIAEDRGLSAVGLADHYLYGAKPADWSGPAYDSLIQTAALARDTSTVEIVMLVSPITFRHPAVYAKSITTVDEISEGRFVFGLGTGWHQGEHDVFGFEFPPLAERFAQLEDALGYLRAFLDEPTAGYEGSHWTLEPVDIRPRAREGLRLMVGGGGPHKTPSLAGRFGDEFNLAHHDPDGVRQRLDVMRSAAVSAGRDPDRILISTTYPLVGGRNDSEIDRFLADWGAASGASGDAMRARIEDRVPIRTWDEHAEVLAGIDDAGFERVYFQVVHAVPWALENAISALT